MDNLLTSQQRLILENIAILKTSTIDKLSEKTGLHRRSIKIILESLQKKSFISRTLLDGKINYFLNDLNSIQDKIEKEFDMLEKLVPSLNLMYQETKNTQVLNILKGSFGLRTVLYDEILKGSRIKAFHLSNIDKELADEYKMNDARRLARNIRIDVLTKRDDKDIPLSRVRSTQMKKSNIDITVYADKLTIVHNKTTADIITLKIPEITKLFSQIFDRKWDESKKVAS